MSEERQKMEGSIDYIDNDGNEWAHSHRYRAVLAALKEAEAQVADVMRSYQEAGQNWHEAEARVKELEAMPDDAGGALGRAILMFREAEAENEALRAERDDLKRKGELLCQAYGEHLIEHGSGGRCGAERDRLRQSRDGMLREAIRALEHWLAKGAKVVWTPYLTPSACRELLQAAGFYGADQLEQARAALASGEESREPAKSEPSAEEWRPIGATMFKAEEVKRG